MTTELLTGPDLYSWDLPTETPINIDDMIYVLSPEDLPMLSGINGDGTPVLPRTGVDNTTFYWLEEEVPLPRGFTNEALDGSETVIDMVVGDAVKFVVGDGIRIDDEVMIVTAVDVSADQLTVARGSAGTTNTTAATHASGAEVIGVGTILAEGLLGSTNFQGRDKYSNYTQIFSKKIQASRTSQVIPKYGIRGNELLHQMSATMRSLMLGIEQSVAYGVKHVQSGTNRRQMGGLDFYISTNEDTSSDFITVGSLTALQQKCYDQGKVFDLCMGKPTNFAALNNTTGAERVQVVSVEDTKRGRARAMSVETEFGTVYLARNRWIRNAEAFCLRREGIVLRQLSPLVTEKLAKTDDTDTYSMVTECGLQVKGEAHMAKFSGLDATATFPTSGLT